MLMLVTWTILAHLGSVKRQPAAAAMMDFTSQKTAAR